MRSIVLGRGRLLSVTVVVMSLAVTAAMSLVFHRTVRIDMLVTGFVCAVVVDVVITRITKHYREKLAQLHADLGRRVHERTAELQRTRDELIARDRMVTAGMLAAGVSHEIRSPLTVVRMGVDELRELVDGAEEAELLRDVNDAAERITAIVNDLSSLAKPADDPVGPIDLDGVIATAARLASYRFGPTVTLVRTTDGALQVLGNASRLVQVFLNLLVNAARATRPDAPNTITVSAEARADRVVVAITDTGTGMSLETQARLFQPFFTTGGTTGGTGLGLVICRSLVERMGGSIDVTSDLGAGTTFAVSLPCAG